MIEARAKEQGLKIINVVRRSEQAEEMRAEWRAPCAVVRRADFDATLSELCKQLRCRMAFDAVGGDLTGRVVEAMGRRSEVLVYGALALEADVAQPRNDDLQGGDGAGLLADRLAGMTRSFPSSSCWRERSQGAARRFCAKQGCGVFDLTEGAEALAAYTSAMSAGKVLISTGASPWASIRRCPRDRAQHGSTAWTSTCRRRDRAAGHAALRDGTYEADEANAAERCVKDGFRVLELGAGIGYVTAICARRTAPENVLAVEANPALIPVIEDNLARNGAEDVTVLHGAVVPRAEEGETTPFACRITFPPPVWPPVAGGAVDVPMIGFHDLLRAHRPHVVLMDIEGAEMHLFDRPWKCPLRFCVLELHPRHYPPRAIKRIVDAMSAMSMTYDPAVSRGKILGFRRVWKNGGDGD
jgi:FkbM family methyltransferase